MMSFIEQNAFHPQPLIKVRELCVDYITENGTFQAVKSVSFDIGKGEIFGLAGESGCGKSTIAFALTQLHRPPALISHGEIIYQQQDLLALSPKALRVIRWSDIAMVFQSAMNALNPVITVGEQFEDVMVRHMGDQVTKQDIKARAQELLEIVNIPKSRLNDYPHQFSGGMRQRLVIAIVLALSPELIIMDEPTTALDVVVQREILQQIYQLRDQFGFSVLFITHDLALMSQLCDRIAVMRHGKIVEVNQAREIRHNPQHPYTQELWSSFPNIHQGRKSVIDLDKVLEEIQ